MGSGAAAQPDRARLLRSLTYGYARQTRIKGAW